VAQEEAAAVNRETDVRAWLEYAEADRLDRRRCQEQLAIWQAGVGDIEALGLTPEEFEAASDLSLLGEVREKGVVYDAAHAERTPAVALRERRAEYASVEGAENEQPPSRDEEQL